MKTKKDSKPYTVRDRFGPGRKFRTLAEARKCKKQMENVTNLGDVSISKRVVPKTGPVYHEIIG